MHLWSDSPAAAVHPLRPRFEIGRWQNNRQVFAQNQMQILAVHDGNALTCGLDLPRGTEYTVGLAFGTSWYYGLPKIRRLPKQVGDWPDTHLAQLDLSEDCILERTP
jgi:hypothetical protein